MQPLQEEESDKSCPNLNADGIFTGSDEGFDFKVLFERFKKDLYPPSLPVYVGYGGCRKVEVVGQEHEFPFAR